MRGSWAPDRTCAIAFEIARTRSVLDKKKKEKKNLPSVISSLCRSDNRVLFAARANKRN